MKETSSYPWSGKIKIELDAETPCEFTLKFRLPGWVREATASGNGEAIDVNAKQSSGYLDVQRMWSRGDAVELDLAMPVERVRSHPNVTMDIGRTCLNHGPVVYCAEQVDNPSVAVDKSGLPGEAKVHAAERTDLSGRIVTVVADDRVASTDDWAGALYRPSPPSEEPATWIAVPYYLWNNREPGKLLVWIPED